MHMIALAYAGTNDNKAIRKSDLPLLDLFAHSSRLLHVGVSDVNDDVRRAAITALGFLLFRYVASLFSPVVLRFTCHFSPSFSTPEQCPSVVSLLCESFNPHVRFGAVMALGIACAGTGLKVW